MQMRVILARRDPGEQHLPLGSLSWGGQEPFAVPSQQVAVVVANPRGHLARGAEDDQLTMGHGIPPYAARQLAERTGMARPSRPNPGTMPTHWLMPVLRCACGPPAKDRGKIRGG